MRQALARQIVECLRLGEPSASHLARLSEFSERNWMRTLTWLEESGLPFYLLRRLRDLQAENLLPLRIKERLERNLKTNQMRVAAIADELRALNHRFEDAGIRFAVLKGLALTPGFCPTAALRYQLDIDYLVPRACAASAASVVRSAGYSREVARGPRIHPWEIRFTADPVQWPAPDHDYYSPSDPRPIELHFSLWEPEDERVDLNVPEDSLERLVTRTCEGVTFPVLSDEDTLLFQALHAFRHMLVFWCRPACFLEIAHFLEQRSSDSDFWSRFRHRIGSRPLLAKVLNLVLGLSVRLFGGRLQTALWTNQSLSDQSSLWIERYAWSWALSFPGSKLTLFLYPEFIPDQSLVRDLLRRRLFPIYCPPLLSMVAPSESSASAEARWQRWRYVFSRARFHGVELLRYGLLQPTWRRALNRNSATRRSASDEATQ